MSSIPFILYSPTKGFSLSVESQAFLTSISSMPIAVLSVVGGYRTGKSFFMNKVLLSRSKGGFSVGPTINPCTKGLWLWNEPLCHKNPSVSSEVKVLLLDTEGFGGLDQNISHNSRIGLLSLLLSSLFVYNSLGIIDENSINSLSLIISLGKEVLKQQEGDSNLFPSLFWVLRDFALQLTDPQGHPITPRDYLERALEGNNKMKEEKQRVRKVIREIFTTRDCGTLVRPVGDEKELQNLDLLEEKAFRPEFLDGVNGIRDKLFSQIRPKKVKGKVLTAGVLLELSRSFIAAINSDGVPDIKATWVYLCRNQMNTAFSGFFSFSD